jgi:hypothetical protein
MPNIISGATWEMSAASLISPTTSQVAVVNAIQSLVGSSTNWAVNTTGTSTAGYKYIEIKPSNVNSLYKDYRILVVERVNTSTSKLLPTSDGGAWNGTSYVYFTFAPDGGAPHVTFTPANIETSSEVYVGTRYKSSTSTVWHTIPMPSTAVWLYLADGAFWFVNRVSATSHTLLGLGHVNVFLGVTDWNTGGTEVGVAGFRKMSGMASTTMATLAFSQGPGGCWYTSTAGTASRTFTQNGNGSQTSFYASNSGAALNIYAGINSSTMFMPVSAWTGAGGVSLISAPYILRGVYLSANMKTRTTITSGGSTAGYTFYPDDAAQGVSQQCLCFLNI